MTTQERAKKAQEKDVLEIQEIVDAVASGSDPDAAAASVVGGEFKLSTDTKKALNSK